MEKLVIHEWGHSTAEHSVGAGTKEGDLLSHTTVTKHSGSKMLNGLFSSCFLLLFTALGQIQQEGN